MLNSHKFMVTTGFAFLICTGQMVKSSTQQLRRSMASNRGLLYDAELDYQEGNRTSRVHLLYDRGKFRQEIIFPGSQLTKAEYMHIYDNTIPHIVWGCNLQMRQAGPLPESCEQALSREARRDGEAAVRQRYKLPMKFPITICADDTQPLKPTMALATRDSLELNPHAIGTEMISGYTCDIYETVAATEEARGHANAQGPSGGQTHAIRVSIEPRSGLVLRLHERISGAASSQMPPRIRGYVVKKIRFPASMPSNQFQLPPGITVFTARIFKEAKLPSGVIQKPGPGKAADIGVDIH